MGFAPENFHTMTASVAVRMIHQLFYACLAGPSLHGTVGKHFTSPIVWFGFLGKLITYISILFRDTLADYIGITPRSQIFGFQSLPE